MGQGDNNQQRVKGGVLSGAGLKSEERRGRGVGGVAGGEREVFPQLADARVST